MDSLSNQSVKAHNTSNHASDRPCCHRCELLQAELDECKSQLNVYVEKELSWQAELAWGEAIEANMDIVIDDIYRHAGFVPPSQVLA